MTLSTEQHLFIDGPSGPLEAIYLPAKVDIDVNVDVDVGNSSHQKYNDHIAILCHPHPLYQGTMNNKVVTTIAKTFFNAGIASIRFNYRGVGKSAGTYGNVTGEIEDCLAVLNYISKNFANSFPNPKIWLAGFSFGAYIAAKIAEQINPVQLITIAPAVNHNPDYYNLHLNCPILVIQGEEDETVPTNEVCLWYEKLNNPNKTLIKIPNASHFFHGKLVILQEDIARHFNF